MKLINVFRDCETRLQSLLQERGDPVLVLDDEDSVYGALPPGMTGWSTGIRIRWDNRLRPRLRGKDTAMTRKVYRVLPNDGNWIVQLDGVSLSSHRTKEPAVERVRAL